MTSEWLEGSSSAPLGVDNSSAVPTDEATPAPRLEGNESC